MSLSLSEVQAEQATFRSQCQSLVLSTLNDNQWPETSYAPFVTDDKGHHYILVSELAAHTRHLLANQKVSWMLIADEQDTRQIFARRRFTCLGHAEVISRDAPEFSPRLEQMQAQFGEIIDLLKSLNDFYLIKLCPEQATYVRGFGQAYRLTGEGLNEIEHLQRS